MPINASLQRRLDSMKAEAQKIRDAHKMSQSAASDKVQKDIELINAKRQQMMDAEKKRMQTQQNRTDEMRDFTAEVELMVTIKEKYASGGFDYETEINDKLKKHGKTDPDAKTAGSSGDAPDAKFSHNGEDHFLEVKKDKNAMYGQIELKHDGQKWHISDKSKAKYPETAKSIEATGFLHKVNKQWGKPSGDYEKDLQLGNVYHTHPDTEPIKAHYGKDRKTNYMQIGGGHGFYHTGEDKAGLGSPELDGKTQLRARMKARGRDAEGKRTYGALIVMGLKDPSKSHHNLDVAVQKEWIEDILMGHKEFKLNEATESAFSIGFRNGQEERIKQNPYAEDTEDYNKYENGFYQGVMQRRVMQTEEIKNPSKKRWHQEPMHPTAPAPYVHRVAVTVSEPDHPMVTKRDETKQKFIRVSDHREDKSVAIERAKKHYSKKGYKVHGAEHVGMVHESVEVTESDAAWAASMEKKKEDKLTNKDKNTLSKLRSMMAKEKNTVKEELDEAKVGDKVEITGGSAKGTTGRIGEIRHGLYKGAPKTYTVYHGEKDATQVKQHLIKRIKEEIETMVVESAPFKKLDHAVAYATDKVKTHRDNLDGIEVYKHKSGGYDVNHTMNASGRNSLQKSGAKHLGTVYKDKPANIKEDLEEGTFKYHMDKAVAAHDRGDVNRKKFHLSNAKQARYALKSTEITKHKDLLDKYKSMTEDTENEEVAANNVGGGAIAGTQGDAGKKVVMTKEPLKRKPMPKFKNYVSQEHDGY